MKKEIFAKRLVLTVLASVPVLFAGCATQGSAPVRDSSPAQTTRAAPKPPPVVVSPVVQEPVAQPGEHVVRRGETLYAVSRLYDVPVQSLIAWNNLLRPEQLEVGQVLRVVAPEVAAVPVAPQPYGVASLPDVKREPRGGKEPWTKQAWAHQHQSDASPPADISGATISRPELSVQEPPPPQPPPSQPRAPEPSASGDWMWPVKGTIISRFDEPSGSDGKVRNRGIDIAGTPGTPVLAAAGGKVAYAGNAVRGLGNMVIVKHSEEYLTAYAHNRVILVSEGDDVVKGQKIAELGNSDTDRPKLHFELRRQGTPVDPLKYLPGL